MIGWSDEQQMLRDAVRKFIEAEIVPHVDDFEHGDTPPYDVLRKLMSTFGMQDMARDRFAKQIAREKEEAATGGAEPAAAKPSAQLRDENAIAFALIPIIELCRHCPGMVTALGVSTGLTASAINSKGTIAQKERGASIS